MSKSDDVPQFKYSVIHEPPEELDALIVKTFGLHKSPFSAITEDDWSFLIKMDALCRSNSKPLTNRAL
jgi:hypothetical protein